MKDSIVNAIESKIENRKKTLELRDKSIEDRMRETRELTMKQKSDRAKEVEDRLQKAKEEVYRREEEEKIMVRFLPSARYNFNISLFFVLLHERPFKE